MDAQVGVLIKGVDKSVDNSAGDEIIDVNDTAVVRDVAVVPDDFTVNVDSAVKVVI